MASLSGGDAPITKINYSMINRKVKFDAFNVSKIIINVDEFYQITKSSKVSFLSADSIATWQAELFGNGIQIN